MMSTHAQFDMCKKCEESTYAIIKQGKLGATQPQPHTHTTSLRRTHNKTDTIRCLPQYRQNVG